MLSKILIVDDDVALTKMLGKLLIEHEYQVVIAYTAEDGVLLAEREQPDLILLDVMVPTMGGWEACKKIRSFSTVPILFLTAMGDAQDIVRGLEMGADDYVVKPFDHAVILARINAHIRRTQQSSNTSEKLIFGDGNLIIHLVNRTVMVNGNERELTPREFDLLLVLARNAGRVVTAEELLDKAWDLHDQEAKANLKPYIHYLRKKIEEDPAAPRWLVTIRGVGYRFAAE